MPSVLDQDGPSAGSFPGRSNADMARGPVDRTGKRRKPRVVEGRETKVPYLRLGIRRKLRAAIQDGPKLNIGPGARWRRAGWLRLDHYVTDADIRLDLRDGKPIPLPSHSVLKIFTSHVIEHLDDRAVDVLFRECHRILRFGGLLRVSCPDVEKAVTQHRLGLCDPNNEVVTRTMVHARSHHKLLNVIASFRAPEYRGIKNDLGGTAYSGGPLASEQEVEERLRTCPLGEFAAWVHSLIPENSTYRAHINAWWPQRVLDALRRAGFRSVRISSFRGSSDAELRLPGFDNRPTISLFAEATATGPVKLGVTAARVTATALAGPPFPIR